MIAEILSTCLNHVKIIWRDTLPPRIMSHWQNGMYSMWVWVHCLGNFPLIHDYQVIQVVTFWSHVWRSRFAFERITEPSSKGHQQNCQVWDTNRYLRQTADLTPLRDHESRPPTTTKQGVEKRWETYREENLTPLQKGTPFSSLGWKS